MANEKLSHKKEIDARRALAEELRNKHKKAEKRRNIAMWSTIGVIVVAIVVAVTLAIVSSIQSKLPVSVTSPNSMTSNGVILTSMTDVVKGNGYNLESGKPEDSKALLKDSKVPHIELYIDYDCPHCATFEDENAEFLNSLLETKKATVEYKPIIVIGSNLSISGANAAACVAEYAPNRFNDANTALFEQHGKQNVSVSNTIKALGIEGEAGTQVEKCVSDKVFNKWVDTATKHALERTDASAAKMVTGTPTVIVDGVKYPFDPSQFETFMNTMIDGGKTAEEVISNK